MLTNFATMLADGTETASELITSAQWDTVAQTITNTAKTAIVPGLAVLAIVVAIPVAKKLFKMISR